MTSKMRIWRAWKVISLGISIAFRLYFAKIRRLSPEETEQLWGRIGRDFRDTLFELNGILLKVAQLMSIREDVLPKSFISEIKDVVDQVPASPWEQIERVLETEWQSPISEKVRHVNPQAIASASIGEVYKGVLLDGTAVAIKVQRPEIPELVKIDFWSLGVVLHIAKYLAPMPKGFIDFNKLYAELRQVIEAELDFHREMQSAMSFSQRFGSQEGILIPAVYPDLSTRRVLVMEWVDAYRINDATAIQACPVSAEELNLRLLKLFLPQWLEAGVFHADPHAGNLLLKEDGTIVLIDFGMVGEISKLDASHFQALIEGLLLKNYTMAAKALDELGFLMPVTDLKQMERSLTQFAALDFDEFKRMDMLEAQKEINALVKSLPIQVPTRFVFLGRSFATIEGIVRQLNPDKEITTLIKPAFMEWLKSSNLSRWELLFKWVQAQPLYHGVQKVIHFIDAPTRAMEQREIHHLQSLRHSTFENGKKHAVTLLIVGLVICAFGLSSADQVLFLFGSGIASISTIGYALIGMRQRKWKRTLKSGRWFG